MPVFTRPDRLVTGLSGLAVGVLGLVMDGLYFVYPGPPPLANVVGRNLITVVMLVGVVVLALGLHRLLRAARGGDAGLAGTFAVTVLVVYAAVSLVATSMEVGGTLQQPDGTVDPTLDGPLAAGMVLLHGPVARILLAGFLLALTMATHRNRVLPRGVQVGSVLLALVNLAMVPSILFGMDAAFGYASNGWGSVAVMGAVDIIWFAVIGGAVLAHRPRVQAVAERDRTAVPAVATNGA